MDSETVLRELFNARFDTLEAKIAVMVSVLEKENDRQDEAIERNADRSTHVSETRRLTERVSKIEDQRDKDQDQRDKDRNQLNDVSYKVKVTWTAGTVIGGIFLSILVAIIKGWIGV
jgi:hypothetical protein